MTKARSSAVRLRDAAPVFAALGDQTRLDLVARLCSSGPQSIVRLSDGASVTRQAITKHLHVLAEAGLIRSTRAGREQVWEILPRRVAEAQHYLVLISAQWDDAIERLQNFVETD
jgi:DNA-binding transcriptional ArsR family regulator